MTRVARSRARARLVVLAITVAAWLLLLAYPHVLTGHAQAQPAGPDATLGTRPARATAPVPLLAAGWALMILAMMTPLLVAPVRHVLERSLKRRRARSVALFAAGHGAVWMGAGAVLLAATLALRSGALHPHLALAIVGVVAVVWQCSPARQRCVNRSHRHPALAAFGAAADRDALRFGATHGAWCVGSCWALMLVPLMVPHSHLAVMAVVTLVLLSDRLEDPRPPAWGLRVPTKLARIAVAQARIRLGAAAGR